MFGHHYKKTNRTFEIDFNFLTLEQQEELINKNPKVIYKKYHWSSISGGALAALLWLGGLVMAIIKIMGY